VNYSQERGKVAEWVKKKLIGEQLDDDVLEEYNPFNRYFTGILYPLSHDQYKDEDEDEDEDEDGEQTPSVKKPTYFQPPSSIGFSFYMQGGVHPIRIFFQASKYEYNKLGHITKWIKKDFGGKEIVVNSCLDTVVSENIFEGEGCIQVVCRRHDKGQIVTVTLINKNFCDSSTKQDDSSTQQRYRALNSFFEVELKCMSYCQMWCMASSSGVLFLIGNLFKSIDEFNAGYNIS